MELEVVPVEVADEISKRTSILVWSMGAGLVAMRNIYTQMIFWDIQTDISQGMLKSIETLKVNLRGFKTSVLERLKNL